MSGQRGSAPTEARINLHNHTTWSDGTHPPAQIVHAAVLHGLTHVGICDHYYTTKLGLPEYHVGGDEIAAYLADLRAVAETHADRIALLAGLEVDWSPRAAAQLPALWSALDDFDYLLFEYVGDQDWGGSSLEALVEALPGEHVPVGLAHSDLCASFGALAPETLVATLEGHDIFVELSTSPGTAYYERDDARTRRLWDLLARSSVSFSIGSDTHDRIDDVGRVDSAHRFLAERGLLGRLITARMDRHAARHAPAQRDAPRRGAQEGSA
jgi:histidinol phosphatase-like PHP family hydrolase